MPHQKQFLDVIDRDEAERRFRSVLSWQPLGEEFIAIDACLGRVLARDVVARTNVPSFDRSNYDGFAVRAADTIGADEQTPRRLMLLPEQLDPGVVADCEIEAGTAVAIATGGMIPRGADAVVMVERCEPDPAEPQQLLVRSAVHAGFGISFTATDVSSGEIVLRAGDNLTSRETGVLAAIGETMVAVWRKPRVAIISTGNEIIAPGQEIRPGLVFDSNSRILSDAVRELGGEPLEMGIVCDDLAQLRDQLNHALAEADMVLLSGGTSKGQGDLSYHVVQELGDPGIVAHGVALKPGKPICLAASAGTPVVILPGFPTSAIFTFHEFVAPVIRAFAGSKANVAATTEAKLAVKVNSEIGRTEYLLVGFVEDAKATADSTSGPSGDHLIAFPMGKGSGSVTTFSQADGFVTIGRHQEIVEAGAKVRVQLLGQGLQRADFVMIGSHCTGLDYLLGQLQRQGWRTKMMAVGSTAGLAAAKQAQCDVAGIHLLDPQSGQYNRPFVTPGLKLVTGYRRRQGIVFRKGDSRFEKKSVREIIAHACRAADCQMVIRMVNRNQGSGTRILIDRLLVQAGVDTLPTGYTVQVKNHHAVAAAVRQGRADWGVAIETVVKTASANEPDKLGFLWIENEQFDFVVPESRCQRGAVAAFLEILAAPKHRQHLDELGFSG